MADFGDLSEEQIKRIRENRERALALKRKRETEDEEVSTAKICEVCCSKEDVSSKLFEMFSIGVCQQCKNKTDDYDFISKSDAASEYLLPDDTLKFLPHTTRENPHKKEWAPMKIFLRKIVREKSYERWKDEDGLKAEHARREVQKYGRQVEKAQAVAESAAAAVHESEDCEDGGGFYRGSAISETSQILAKMLAGAPTASLEEHAPSKLPKSGKKSMKVNKNAVANMMKCIVGTKNSE